MIINKETGTYYTVESPKENEDISNDYSFIITSKFLSVFAGYTLDLYFSNNRRSPIVVKSPKEWEDNFNVSITYVACPVWQRGV